MSTSTSSDGSSHLPPELARIYRIVHDDRTHGASWIARYIATALAEVLRSSPPSTDDQSLLSIRALLRQITSARPSMAAVANSAAALWAAADTADVPALRLQSLLDAAEQAVQAWDTAASRILEASRPLLSGTLLTHSHSGTVESVLTGLVANAPGRSKHIIVTQSHPGDEGITSARALARAGGRVTLIADAACGLYMPEVHAVVIGADSVRDDGSVVNKIGSYPLALVARSQNVPVYVLCEMLKIAPTSLPLAFEEMSAAELGAQPEDGLEVRNVYFDRTPHELLSGILTERGMLTRDLIGAWAREHDTALRHLLRG